MIHCWHCENEATTSVEIGKNLRQMVCEECYSSANAVRFDRKTNAAQDATAEERRPLSAGMAGTINRYASTKRSEPNSSCAFIAFGRE